MRQKLIEPTRQELLILAIERTGFDKSFFEVQDYESLLCFAGISWPEFREDTQDLIAERNIQLNKIKNLRSKQ